MSGENLIKMPNNHKVNLPWFSILSPYLIIVYAIIYLITGFLTLSGYGLTWDEGLGNIFFGERYFFFLKTFNPVYLDFSKDLFVDHIFKINLFSSPSRLSPIEFPPISDIFSAGTMYLFSYKLKLLDPIDGFHSFKIILASLFLVAIYWFVAGRLGKATAWISVLFLSLFPRFWADMHFNPKDIPETIFFSLTIIAFYFWYEKRNSITKWKSFYGAIIIGLLFGCALSAKANGIFIPFIVLLSIIPLSINIKVWSNWIKQNISCLPYIILMIVSGLLFYISSWPYLYSNPLQVVNYWKSMASLSIRNNAFVNWDALIQTITTMPEIMLFFLVFGFLFMCLHNPKNITFLSRILITWTIFPIIRSSLPGIGNFDGIRHFLEFLPAAAIISACGVVQTSNWLANKINASKKYLKVVFIVVFGFNILFIGIQYQTFSYLYYNSIIGGLSGAKNNYLGGEATDYWASSYRQGINWLNQHADSNSELITPIAPWIVDITAPLWLRPDIQVKSNPDIDVLKTESGSRSIYIMFITRQSFYNPLTNYCINQLKPIYQIIIDQVPVLEIYRFER